MDVSKYIHTMNAIKQIALLQKSNQIEISPPINRRILFGKSAQWNFPFQF